MRIEFQRELILAAEDQAERVAVEGLCAARIGRADKGNDLAGTDRATYGRPAAFGGLARARRLACHASVSSEKPCCRNTSLAP